MVTERRDMDSDASEYLEEGEPVPCFDFLIVNSKFGHGQSHLSNIFETFRCVIFP